MTGILEIRNAVHYDPATGIFTNKARRSHRAPGAPLGVLESNGYLRFVLFGKKWWVHRLAWVYMTGETPIEIDHINGIRFDNRFVNLRNVTTKENAQNKRGGIGESKVLGVGWDKRRSKWRAWMQVDGKFVDLGSYSTPEQAVDARIAGERLHFPMAPTRDRGQMVETLMANVGTRYTLTGASIP